MAPVDKRESCMMVLLSDYERKMNSQTYSTRSMRQGVWGGGDPESGIFPSSLSSRTLESIRSSQNIAFTQLLFRQVSLKAPNKLLTSPFLAGCVLWHSSTSILITKAFHQT